MPKFNVRVKTAFIVAISVEAEDEDTAVAMVEDGQLDDEIADLLKYEPIEDLYVLSAKEEV